MSHADTFHQLHAGPDLLVLPNAWDCASAKLLETLGAKAVATSSAAVAWSHGHADGHFLPVPLLAQTVRDIARVIALPLSADIEGGYADDPAGVAQTVSAVVDAGAVGINIEDGVLAPDLLCAKIGAARAAADRAGVKLFINARTDVYLRRLAEGEAALAETIRRAALYVAAGADGVFVPGIHASADIETAAREIAAPVNVMARPGVPPAAELQRLGARRLSAGTSFMAVALAGVKSAAQAYLETGDSEALSALAVSPLNFNTAFSRH
jgi:2-methylisocitrate lyase-like PEP mutase family enzyme